MGETDRERELRRRLDELRERFAKDAKPLWDELTGIEIGKSGGNLRAEINKALFDLLYPGLPYPDLVEKDGVFYARNEKSPDPQP